LPGTNTRVLYGYLSGVVHVPSLDFYGPDGKLLATYQVMPGNTTLQETARYLYLEGKPVTSTEDRLGSAGNYMPYGDYNPAAQAPGIYGTYYADNGTGSGGFFANQRYYNLNWGRFLTVDPLGSSAKLAIPQSWNRYGYVVGDPVNANDPTGLDCRQVASGENGNGSVCTGPTDPSLIMRLNVTEKAGADPMYNLGQVVDILDNLMSAAFMVSFPGFDPLSLSPSRDGGGQGVSNSAPNNGPQPQKPQPQQPQQPTQPSCKSALGAMAIGGVVTAGEVALVVYLAKSGELEAFDWGHIGPILAPGPTLVSQGWLQWTNCKW